MCGRNGEIKWKARQHRGLKRLRDFIICALAIFTGIEYLQEDSTVRMPTPNQLFGHLDNLNTFTRNTSGRVLHISREWVIPT